MRQNLSFIQHRMAINLAESGTDIVLTWNTWPDGTQRDAVTGAMQGTPIPQTATVKGFVHYIQPATTVPRLFNETEAGDCIIEVAPDAPLDGKEDLVFTIAGQKWVAKAISDQLATTWDATVRGQKLYRSVLLRKQT